MRLAVLSVIVGIASGGCATVVPQPDLPVENGLPTLDSISTRIACELAQTLHASPRNYQVLMSNDVDVALQLSLTVTDSGSLAPSFTYIADPTFSFNTGLNLSKYREQNHFQKMYFSMRRLDREFNLRKKVLGRNVEEYCSRVDHDLAGEIGLRKSFELALTASNRLQWEDINLSAQEGSFGGYVEFGITRNLNAVGPTWVLRHFRGPGGLAGLSEVSVNKLTFAFARGSEAGKPFDYIGPSRNSAAERLLEQINVNQLSTQLGSLRQVLQ